MNVGPAHYFVCHEHRTRWMAGYNLFSTWRQQTVADWHSNQQEIADYDEVQPIYPDLTNDQEPEIER